MCLCRNIMRELRARIYNDPLTTHPPIPEHVVGNHVVSTSFIYVAFYIELQYGDARYIGKSRRSEIQMSMDGELARLTLNGDR